MTLVIDKSSPESRLAVQPWRVVTSHDKPGDYLMAVDEALLEAVIAGGTPVVRFYTWQPATLSLGVNQHIGEVNSEECTRRGFGLVRRLTGGRAVLHQHELTYSVIAHENDPRVSGGVIESYRKISAALVEGLRTLGVDVRLAEPSPAVRRVVSPSAQGSAGETGEMADIDNGAVCFDVASAYEITAGGKKLVGSAQARRGGAILQHGSILLDIDWDALVSVFAYVSEAGKQRACAKLPTRMTSLRAELGRAVSPEEVQRALVGSFERMLSISLTPADPSAEEEDAALRLCHQKYGAREWTYKI